MSTFIYSPTVLPSPTPPLPSPPAPGAELRKPQIQDAFQSGKSKESRIEQAWRTKNKPQQAPESASVWAVLSDLACLTPALGEAKGPCNRR